MKEEPTNSELMRVLGGMQSDLSHVKDQTTRTNGRVNAIEKWISDYKVRHEERARMRKEQAELNKPNIQNVESVVVNKSVWNDPKLVNAVLAALAAVAGFLISNSGGA